MKQCLKKSYLQKFKRVFNMKKFKDEYKKRDVNITYYFSNNLVFDL